jgi:hypothetical protein
MHIGGLVLGGLAVLILRQPPLTANTVFFLVLTFSGWMLLTLEKGE